MNVVRGNSSRRGEKESSTRPWPSETAAAGASAELSASQTTAYQQPKHEDSLHQRGTARIQKPLVVSADVHFVFSPVWKPGHRLCWSSGCRAKFQAGRTKPGCIFRASSMATGGEESELESSTPTRSSAKKVPAVKKWKRQENAARKCERNI